MIALTRLLVAASVVSVCVFAPSQAVGDSVNKTVGDSVNKTVGSNVNKAVGSNVNITHRNNIYLTGAQLGDKCEEDGHCSDMETASTCRGNKCVACADATEAYEEYANCKDKHGCALHEYDNKCWKYREIGEPCTAHQECFIYPTAHTTRLCNDSICVCNSAEGYVYISSPKFGIDKCFLVEALPKPQGQDDTSAGNAISSPLWSALAALLVTTHITLQHRCRLGQ